MLTGDISISLDSCLCIKIFEFTNPFFVFVQGDKVFASVSRRDAQLLIVPTVSRDVSLKYIFAKIAQKSIVVHDVTRPLLVLKHFFRSKGQLFLKCVPCFHGC